MPHRSTALIARRALVALIATLSELVGSHMVRGESAAAAAVASADCTNEHDNAACDSWAEAGECKANPGFMLRACARSCQSCGWRNTYCDKRNNGPAKSEGDIIGSFERAVKLPGLKPTVHSVDPYVVTFDDFVSDEEADAFISTTRDHFERSLAGDIVSPVRTSQQVRFARAGIALLFRGRYGLR